MHLSGCAVGLQFQVLALIFIWWGWGRKEEDLVFWGQGCSNGLSNLQLPVHSTQSTIQRA